MNVLLILFTILPFNKINTYLLDKLYEKLKLPSWHIPNILCYKDEDCPLPYACCYDAIFPMKDKYCCINYKKRHYKYAYAYNEIKS
jgi:hypothetical protein